MKLFSWACSLGTPDHDYLWILARTSTLEEAGYQDAVSFAQNLGFHTEQLIRAPTRAD
jgi:lipocalin